MEINEQFRSSHLPIAKMSSSSSDEDHLIWNGHVRSQRSHIEIAYSAHAENAVNAELSKVPVDLCTAKMIDGIFKEMSRKTLAGLLKTEEMPSKLDIREGKRERHLTSAAQNHECGLEYANNKLIDSPRFTNKTCNNLLEI